MQVIAIIPARGGSKGLPRKNIRPLARKPLIAYSIEAALQSDVLNRVAVSTEDDEIAAIALKYGAEVLKRPPELAEDDSTTRAVLWHHVRELADEGYLPDAVMTLQPTSPLRRAEHIREALALFAADDRADSLVSCLAVPHVFHPLSVMRWDAAGYLVPYFDNVPLPTRRQDKPPAMARNGAAVYITRTARLADYVFGGRLIGYQMDEESSLDIDSLADLERAEAILAARTL